MSKKGEFNGKSFNDLPREYRVAKLRASWESKSEEEKLEIGRRRSEGTARAWAIDNESNRRRREQLAKAREGSRKFIRENPEEQTRRIKEGVRKAKENEIWKILSLGLI